jgi:hypothetical protein
MRWHAIAHDRVVEGLPLSGVEAENLDVAADPGKQRRKRSILVRPLTLTTDLPPVAAAFVVVPLVEVIVSLNRNDGKVKK